MSTVDSNSYERCDSDVNQPCGALYHDLPQRSRIEFSSAAAQAAKNPNKEVREQRSEIRGQRSEVRDQRSEIRGQRKLLGGGGGGPKARHQLIR
jgi:hypothetical protein